MAQAAVPLKIGDQGNVGAMKNYFFPLLLLVLTGPAAAEVVVQTSPEGKKTIVNIRSAPKVYNRTPPRRVRSVDSIERLIEVQARAEELDPNLVRAIVQVESAFNPNALSPKGAMGLMQLMPAVADQFQVADPYEPEQNLRGGTQYFKQLMDVFAGQLELALAGYNAGPSAVERFGGIPPYSETRDYVQKVLALYWGEGVDLSEYSTSRRTYLARDPRGQLLLTTSAPSRR